MIEGKAGEIGSVGQNRREPKYNIELTSVA